MATKTQVTDGVSRVSGTITLSNLNQPMHDETPVQLCAVHAGSAFCYITDITAVGWGGADPQPDPPEGTMASFCVRLYNPTPGAGPIHDEHYFVYVPTAGPYGFSVDYNVAISYQRLWRDRTDAPTHGRDNSPVYASDTTMTDSLVLEYPASIDATFGSLTWTETQTEWAPDVWEPPLEALSGVTLNYSMMSCTAGYEFARITVNWNGVAANFSGRSKLVTGDTRRLVGSGSAVYLESLLDDDTDPGELYQVTYGLPQVVDLQPHVWDRAGVDVDDVRLSLGIIASPLIPETLTWSTTP